MHLRSRPVPLSIPRPAGQPPQVVGNRLAGVFLPAASAPRPYLHPVQTLAGTVVTGAAPPDHGHHLGVCVAVSDLNGTNFWGGSTYVPGSGAQLLPNHGRQVITASGPGSSPNVLSDVIQWHAADDSLLAEEKRTYETVRHLDSRCWSLSLSSVIGPAGGNRELRFSSSAVKGREGAGYGGIFWRLPESTAVQEVFTSGGAGVAQAHGSMSSWLCLVVTVDGADVSLVFSQEGQVLPWFVRTSGYVGVGSSIAWSTERVVRRDNPLRLNLSVLLADGLVTRDGAQRLLHGHPR